MEAKLKMTFRFIATCIYSSFAGIAAIMGISCGKVGVLEDVIYESQILQFWDEFKERFLYSDEVFFVRIVSSGLSGISRPAEDSSYTLLNVEGFLDCEVLKSLKGKRLRAKDKIRLSVYSERSDVESLQGDLLHESFALIFIDHEYLKEGKCGKFSSVGDAYDRYFYAEKLDSRNRRVQIRNEIIGLTTKNFFERFDIAFSWPRFLLAKESYTTRKIENKKGEIQEIMEDAERNNN